MYQTLASFNYLHEYGKDAEFTGLHSVATSATAKNLHAMNALIRQDLYGFSIQWDAARLSRAELVDLFAEEELVFFIQPRSRDKFYAITDNLALYAGDDKQGAAEQDANSQDNSKHASEGNKVKAETTKLPYAHIFFADASLRSTTGINLSVNRLQKNACFADVLSGELGDQSSEQSGIAENTQGVNSAELREVCQQGVQKHIIALALPIRSLGENTKASAITLQFQAKSLRQKYYFSRHRPDESLKLRCQSLANNLVSNQTLNQSSSGSEQGSSQTDNKSENNSVNNSEESDLPTFYPLSEYLDGKSSVQVFVSSHLIKLKQQCPYQLSLVKEVAGVDYTLIDHLPQPKPDQFFHHHDATLGNVTVLEAFIN